MRPFSLSLSDTRRDGAVAPPAARAPLIGIHNVRCFLLLFYTHLSRCQSPRTLRHTRPCDTDDYFSKYTRSRKPEREAEHCHLQQNVSLRLLTAPGRPTLTHLSLLFTPRGTRVKYITHHCLVARGTTLACASAASSRR